MPTSEVEIANMALAHCGITSYIGNFTTEDTNEANTCRLFFDQVRDVLLETLPWNFAKRRVALQDIGSPPDEWVYRYQYPNTCMLAIEIINPSVRTESVEEKVPFAIEDQDDATGRCILTDEQNAILLYNHKIENIALYTPSFSQALAFGLAAHVATPLRADARIASALKNEWQVWLSEAGSRSLREEQEDPNPPSEFVQVRM